MEFSESAIIKRLLSHKRQLMCCDGTVCSDYEVHRFLSAFMDRIPGAFDDCGVHFTHHVDCPQAMDIAVWTQRPLEMEPGRFLGVECGPKLFSLKGIGWQPK